MKRHTFVNLIDTDFSQHDKDILNGISWRELENVYDTRNGGEDSFNSKSLIFFESLDALIDELEDIKIELQSDLEDEREENQYEEEYDTEELTEIENEIYMIKKLKEYMTQNDISLMFI